MAKIIISDLSELLDVVGHVFGRGDGLTSPESAERTHPPLRRLHLLTRPLWGKGKGDLVVSLREEKNGGVAKPMQGCLFVERLWV